MSRVDLEAFDRLGRLDTNPMLLDGDVIQVPKLRERAWIAGAVPKALEMEIAQGDDIAILIGMAGGLIPAATPEQAFMVRFRSGARVPERRPDRLHGDPDAAPRWRSAIRALEAAVPLPAERLDRRRGRASRVLSDRRRPPSAERPDRLGGRLPPHGQPRGRAPDSWHRGRQGSRP
jgi:hypothetical protein